MRKTKPALLALALAIGVVVTLPAGLVRAGWQWTAPAAHHRAAVKIRSPANSRSNTSPA